MRITTVLFDIGGVLIPDPYETILLHKEYGLGLSLGLNFEELSKKLKPVLRKYFILPNATESDFRNDVGKTLGIELNAHEVAAVRERVVIPNLEATACFKLLRDSGIRVGVISNNTPFSYAIQAKLLLLDDYIEPDLVFLSYKKGCLKSDGLYELAAASLDPASTFVIDDRLSNVEYAQKVGFGAVVYAMEQSESLLALTKKIPSYASSQISPSTP